MAELVVMWLEHNEDPENLRPKPGDILQIVPDGTLDNVKPEKGSHVNFIHIDNVPVHVVERLLEPKRSKILNASGEYEFLSRRQFRTKIADLPQAMRTKWLAQEPLTMSFGQAKQYIVDIDEKENW